MKKVLFLLLFVLYSCRSISYDDVNAEINPNTNKLPYLSPVVDIYNLESVYTRGRINTRTSSTGGAYAQNNYTLENYQSNSVSTISNDIRVNDAINIFRREVNENITEGVGDPAGTIILRVGYRFSDNYDSLKFLSIISMFSLNLIGFPLDYQKEYLEVEIEIMDKNKKIIKRYRESAESSGFVSLYYGYQEEELKRKLCADNMKKSIENIRKKINIDSTELRKKLIIK